jgi:hypothetical protein
MLGVGAADSVAALGVGAAAGVAALGQGAVAGGAALEQAADASEGVLMVAAASGGIHIARGCGRCCWELELLASSRGTVIHRELSDLFWSKTPI